jgi:hypothetical protein
MNDHLFKIELDESQKEFQRGSEHMVTNFEGLMAIAQPKTKKDKLEVEKKEKILRKLVVEKENKIFNVAKCRLIKNTLGNEFLG